MLKKVNPFLPYVACGLVMVGVGCVSFYLSKPTTDAVDQKQALSFDSCYPSTYQQPHAVYSVPDRESTLWEVEAYSHDLNAPSVSMLHFRTKPAEGRMRCKWLNRNVPAYRTDYLEKPVAIAFAKLRYEPLLNQCIASNQEIDACKQELIDGLSGTRNNPRILFPEDIFALSQLGVAVNSLQRVRLIKSSSEL